MADSYNKDKEIQSSNKRSSPDMTATFGFQNQIGEQHSGSQIKTFSE